MKQIKLKYKEKLEMDLLCSILLVLRIFIISFGDIRETLKTNCIVF